MLTPLLMLAQAATTAPAAPPKPWWQILLENGLPLTILFIFLAAIVGVVVNLRRKDKCLKLFGGYHVSYLTTAGQAVWGDLVVYSQGLELQFDAPYTTRRGLIKSSAMIYEPEMAACLALCRVDSALPPDEKRNRARQVRRSFRPGLIRRTLRWIRNIINTLRDAFSKALTAIIGQLTKVRPTPTGIAAQQPQLNEIGQTLLGAAGNAYEPILEAHIGKPVILKLTGPAGPTQQPLELPGYLVDYTDKYLAVFNVEHTPLERLELELSENLEQPNLKVEMIEADAVITCTGPEVIVVVESQSGSRTSGLSVPLTPGCALRVPREPGQPVRLVLERTRRIDIVCPRAIAKIYFGAETQFAGPAHGHGLAPSRMAEASV